MGETADAKVIDSAAGTMAKEPAPAHDGVPAGFASPASSRPAPQQQEDEGDAALPFEFTGSGGEYFRIWVVNVLLTFLTLGIYSAWAKVRRTQYFYRNTRLAGSVFDYRGNP